jgi:CheY-like chemotaxis protein
MGDILIVDDEVKLRTLLARTLASAGHRPVTVPDGESACAHLDAHSTDLVLLDLVMPGMDGLSVLRHVPPRASGRQVGPECHQGVRPLSGGRQVAVMELSCPAPSACPET